MKKIVCLFLIITLSLSSTTAHAIDESSCETPVVTEIIDGPVPNVAYYVSGFYYGPGMSQISYYVSTAVIMVYGPSGLMFSLSVSGSGSFTLSTPAGAYHASATGCATSYWTVFN